MMNLRIVTGIITLFVFVGMAGWLRHRKQQRPRTRKRGRLRAVFRKARITPVATLCSLLSSRLVRQVQLLEG